MTNPDPKEQAEISAILKRCRTNLKYVRVIDCKDIHVVAARNAIISFLYERCWPENQIAAWLDLPRQYVDSVVVQHYVEKTLDKIERGRVV